MKVTPYTRTHQLPSEIRQCISELESLSISPTKINELNDVYEMEDLVDNIKLTMFQDFKSAC